MRDTRRVLTVPLPQKTVQYHHLHQEIVGCEGGYLMDPLLLMVVFHAVKIDI